MPVERKPKTEENLAARGRDSKTPTSDSVASPELLEKLTRLTGLRTEPGSFDLDGLLQTLSAFLELSRTISGTLSIQEMLDRSCRLVADILDAERCTIFLHDPGPDELFTRASMDPTMTEVRFPSSAGIAGHVFQNGEALVIPDAYEDPRFNPAIDRKTGFKTRNIMSVPIRYREDRHRVVGVAQALNKRDGDFESHDLELFEALLAYAAPALIHAQLFEEVSRVRNYNESVLQSMSNGLLTVSPGGIVEKVNQAAARMLGADGDADELIGRDFRKLIAEENAWLKSAMEAVRSTGRPETILDVDLVIPRDEENATVSVNAGVVQLRDARDREQGFLLVLEDLSREKRVLGTMARYMSKEVADRVLEEESEVLGGVLQKVTVLFADIRGFTAISERIGPQETVRLLNQYFTIMAEVIHEHEGVLDKYIGDALMALFGAPFASEDDADRGVRAAQAMIEGLEEFNRTLVDQGQEPIGIGIGVNTDDVVLGNIGSPRRMDFTVIGDGVNLASRLEAANKVYGTRILASESTLQNLQQEHPVREVDQLRVKGKERPVTLFEVFTEDSNLSKGTLAEYREGLECYRARCWKKALQHFKRVLEAVPGDSVAELYIGRCRHFETEPPGEEWDGVWTMTHK